VKRCSSGGRNCPLTHRPINIWDVPSEQLRDCQLTQDQQQGIFPENT
jgi:hypothetical protein